MQAKGLSTSGVTTAGPMNQQKKQIETAPMANAEELEGSLPVHSVNLLS